MLQGTWLSLTMSAHAKLLDIPESLSDYQKRCCTSGRKQCHWSDQPQAANNEEQNTEELRWGVCQQSIAWEESVFLYTLSLSTIPTIFLSSPSSLLYISLLQAGLWSSSGLVSCLPLKTVPGGGRRTNGYKDINCQEKKGSVNQWHAPEPVSKKLLASWASKYKAEGSVSQM